MGNPPPRSRACLRNSAGTQIDVAVVNQSLTDEVSARFGLSGRHHGKSASVLTLNGPSATSINTPADSSLVALAKSKLSVGTGTFDYDFPAHSLTLIELNGDS